MGINGFVATVFRDNSGITFDRTGINGLVLLEKRYWAKKLGFSWKSARSTDQMHTGQIHSQDIKIGDSPIGYESWLEI